jgi:hypothetical protein
MGLIDRVNSWVTAAPARSWPTISWDDYFSQVSIGGNTYLTGALQQTIKGNAEEIGDGYDALIQQAYRSNAVVFACELARISLFSEARFQFQRMRGGRPGELYSLDSLSVLEHPWPTAITGDLLTRVLLDADFGGTAFMVRRDRNTIRRLRPDWVSMVLGSENDPDVEGGDIDADVLGIIYYPGGKKSGREPETILRENVAIFAPIPDPLASFRGMPWVVPVIKEIIADKQMTDHKSAYLVNGATPNLTVAIDKDLKEASNPAAFAEWVEAFKKTNPTSNQWERYKTWYLAGGTTVTKVGADLGSAGADFKQVQGAGETRIAAAAGVPPVIVGLSEGLQAATYSNYGQARRRFADNTMRPLWRNMAGSLETIVPPPTGARLWYDDRDIQALAEDKKDLAEVRALDAQQIRTLSDAGAEWDAVIDAVTTGDYTRLKGSHTGLYSVQLQPAGTVTAPPEKPTPEPPQSPRDAALASLLAAAERRADAAERRDAPVINVHPPDVTVPVTFERGAFEAPSFPAPATPEPTPATPTVTELEYDEDGRVVKIIESPE